MTNRYPAEERDQKRLQELLRNLTGEFESIQHPDHLKGRTLPAYVDIADTGHTSSSTRATAAARETAAERSVPGRFDAVRVKYHPKTQTYTLIPEAAYVETDEELEPVTWSPDEREFRTDLYNKLVAKNWETPAGMIRRVPVYPVKALPGLGAALVLDMPNGTLRPKPRSKRSKKAADTASQPNTAVQGGTQNGQSSSAPQQHPAATDQPSSDHE